MALNKNALIRYRAIDKCLQNKYRKWTLDHLIEACSEALYEYEGRDVSVSKRTVQLDIQMLRGDKLGYNAPIEVYERKYYRYAQEDYSITDIPLTESDMDILLESVEMLRQFKEFSLFAELGGIIQRLEDKVYTEKTHQKPIIYLDKNENLKGLEYLDTLYQAILKKLVLKIRYQSFKARHPSDYTFHPYILKEFNNRWFVIGRILKDRPIINLALDRIQHIEWDTSTPYLHEDFDGGKYYKNTIGVTVLSEEHLCEVVLWVSSGHAPYVLTKPLHRSQELLETLADGSVRLRLYVHLNYELESLILGFGAAVTVEKPKVLRQRIQQNLRAALRKYDHQ